MLIDTHCHLDAAEFDADRPAVIERARRAGVRGIVIPAVARANFAAVRDLAHATPGACYALGIHPLYVERSAEADLDALDAALAAARDDPRLVAVGEIGLDFFVEEARAPERRERQERFYTRQLDLARRHGLPVLLHVRRSQDVLLKHLRRRPPIGGIAHAFNGSFQQAGQFIAQGFALGLGGAMTFERARQIRRLAAQLPAETLVLETDAPDIPPAWLGRGADGRPRPARNEPAQTAGIARVLAGLRGLDAEALIAQCAVNARRVLPRLARALGEADGA
ncbi:TatD family hydrolase [Castellaniella defragrans]|uniref:TatD DNase family protein n=1 Tax=Castellaniella defragrans TaxID=75697 RepID=A0A7W9TKU2_CASDE|nr:TatD family hydrolase [Castellaniella defragrans]KAB0607142.1 TatD family deoxyribonuclease [Castellaniella defragrans]MBB6082256.1 TatD DNase family protein [Castellaniella defragrans]